MDIGQGAFQHPGPPNLPIAGMGQIGVARWIAFNPQRKQARRRVAEGEIKCKGISSGRYINLKALFAEVLRHTLNEVSLGMSGTGRYTGAIRAVKTVKQRLRFVEMALRDSRGIQQVGLQEVPWPLRRLALTVGITDLLDWH